MLAAVFGTGALSPVTAPGLAAARWQKNLVHVSFKRLGVAIIAATLAMRWGPRDRALA